MLMELNKLLEKLKLQRRGSVLGILETIEHLSNNGSFELVEGFSIEKQYYKWLKEEELRSDEDIIKLEVKHGRLH